MNGTALVRITHSAGRHFPALLEREVSSRGSIALLLVAAVTSTLVAAGQLSVQGNAAMTESLWELLPLGLHPAYAIAGWVGVATGFRTAASRINSDAESGWPGVLHAESVPAAGYVLSAWMVAAMLAAVAILAGYAAIAVAQHLVPPPSWAPNPAGRMLAGALALALDFTAIGVLASTLLRGATRATAVVIAVVVAPIALSSMFVARGTPLPESIVRITTFHLPPLWQAGSWWLIVPQLVHAALMLALAAAFAGPRLVRRP